MRQANERLRPEAERVESAERFRYPDRHQAFPPQGLAPPSYVTSNAVFLWRQFHW